MANSIGSSGHFLSGAKAVSAAGTAEALVSGLGALYRSLVIVAKGDNTGQVYVGGDDVASTTNDGLDAGDALSLPRGDQPYDLSLIFIDVDTNAEGVDFYAVSG